MVPSKENVGSMWACGGRASSSVSLCVCLQSIFEGRARQPAGREPYRHVQAAEAFKSLCEARDQAFQRSLPSFGYGHPVLHELTIPSRDLAVACTQRGVALLQSAVVASPMQTKGWFHVEHQPVEPASPPFWTLINELVNLGIDCLDGKHAGELEQGQRIRTVDPGACASICADLDAGAFGRQVVRAAEYGELRLVVPDKPLGTARPERSAAAQQEYRLENGCLAGPVFPGDEIEFRGKLEHR